MGAVLPRTRCAQAFRAPERRKERASPHPAAPHAGPRSPHHPAPEAPPRAPVSRRGRRVPAPAARAMDAALPRPPHGVSVSSALPAQETRLAAPRSTTRRAALFAPPVRRFGGLAGPPNAFRIPGSFSKSSIWRRNPARARDRLPASSGRPASLTCAADSAALRQQGYLTPLPAREPSEGGREGSGATPAEKIGASRAFSPRASGIPR